MPTLHVEDLSCIAQGILEGLGTPADSARAVQDSLIEANLHCMRHMFAQDRLNRLPSPPSKGDSLPRRTWTEPGGGGKWQRDWPLRR